MQKYKNKKITKSGMTLMELMIVVAIMVILFGVGAPAVNAIKRSLNWKEVNGVAEELYMVAQNQAIHMRSTNSLGDASSPNSFYDYTTATKHNVTAKPSDYTKDDQKYKNLYYINDMQSDAVSYLVPQVTQDSIDGSYLIEVNPASGDVYGVFYSDTLTSAQLVKAYEDGTASSGTGDDDFRTGTSPRKDYKDSDDVKHMIGYYGGGDIDAGLSGDGNQVKLTAYNKEQLYVKATIPNALLTEGNFRVDFVIEDEHGNKIVRTGTDANTANPDINKPLCEQKTELNSDGTIYQVDAYLILDDCMNTETKSKDEPHKFSELNKGLTPGDDITIYAQASYIADHKYITTKLDNTTNTVTVNSLFGEGTNYKETDENGNLKDGEIDISTCRHFRNLENIRSAATVTTAEREQLITVKQTNDLNFKKSAVKNGTAVIYQTNFTAAEKYTEVNNAFLFGTNLENYTDGEPYANTDNEYDGQGNEIKNLYIESGSELGVGLFGAYNCKVTDVHMHDVKVVSTNANTEGTGALIGNASGGHSVITDCGVYCTPVGETSSFDEDPIVTGSSNVGGLVGVIKNGEDQHTKGAYIRDSFAAIDVTASTSTAGGLVGAMLDYYNLKKLTANDDAILEYRMNFYRKFYSDNILTGEDNDDYYCIMNCYTSGNVSGPKDVGGICGTAQGGVKKSYSTSNVTSDGHCGGIVGKFWDSGKVQNCMYYGKVISTSDYAGIIVDRAVNNHSSEYYEVQMNFEGKTENMTPCQKYRARDSVAGQWKSMTVYGCNYLRMDDYNDSLYGSWTSGVLGFLTWFKTVMDKSTGYDGVAPMTVSDTGLVSQFSSALQYLGIDLRFIRTNSYDKLKVTNVSGRSFPYKESLEGEDFPFEMVENIGYHYGNWVTDDDSDDKKGKVRNGLIYYERYSDGTLGYYGNVNIITDDGTKRGSLASLATDKTITTAGYAIISSTKSSFEVTADGVTSTVSGNQIGSVSISETGVTGLEEATINIFAITDPAAGTRSSYYVSYNIDGKDYYYNPDVAMSATTSDGDPSIATVRTAEQLYRIGKNEYYLDKTGFTFTQSMDIDYTTYDGGSGFNNVPIGSTVSGGKTFASTYDGAGYEIKGYNLSASSNNAGTAQCYGLFSQVSGTIRNVHLVGDGNNTIKVDYSSNSNGAAVGGLVGWLNGGTITNSTVSGYEITASGSNSKIVVGGLVGEVQSGAISNSTAVNKTVGVTDSGSSCVGVGGLVGALNSGSVKNAYAGGAIQCNNTSAVLGGLTGEDKSTVVGPCSGTTGNSTVTNCYSYCTYDNEKTYSNVSGVTAGATADNCYYFDETGYDKMATDPSGVTALTFSKLKKADLGTSFGTADKNHSYPWDALGKNYPFKAVVRDTSNNFVHYGNWPTSNKFNGTVGIIRQYKYKGNTYYEVSAVVVEKGVITKRIDKERGLTSIPSYASSATFTNKNDWCVFWYDADAADGELTYSVDAGATSSSMPSEGTGADSAGNTKDAISVQFMYDGSTFATVDLDALIGNGTVGIIRQYKHLGSDAYNYEVYKIELEDGEAISSETQHDLTAIPSYASSASLSKVNEWGVFWSGVDNKLISCDATGNTTTKHVTIETSDGYQKVESTAYPLSATFVYDGTTLSEKASLPRLAQLNGKMGIIRRVKSQGTVKYQIQTITATYNATTGKISKSVDSASTYLEKDLPAYAEAAAGKLTEKNQWCAFWYDLSEESSYKLVYSTSGSESGVSIKTNTNNGSITKSKDEVSATFTYNGNKLGTVTLGALNKLSGTVGVIRKYKPRGSSSYKYQVCELVISDNTVTTTKTYTGDTAQDAIPSDISSASTAINNSLKNSNEWCVFSSNLNVDSGEDVTYGTSNTEITASDSAGTANSGTDKVSVQFKYGDTVLGTAELPALKKLSGTIGVIRQYKPRGSESYMYEIDRLVVNNGTVTNSGHSRERYDNYDELCKNAKYAQSAADNLSGNYSWCTFWYDLNDETGASVTCRSKHSANPVTIADSVTGNRTPSNGSADIIMIFQYAGNDLGTATLTALSKLSGTVGIIRQYKPLGSTSYKYEIDRLEISDGKVTNTSHSRERYDSLAKLSDSDSAKAAATKLASENKNNIYCIFWNGLTDESGETLKYGSTEISGTDGNTTPVAPYKDAISVDFTYGGNALGTTNLAALTRLSGTVGIIRRYNMLGSARYEYCELTISDGKVTNTTTTRGQKSIPTEASSVASLNRHHWAVFWSGISDESGGAVSLGDTSITSSNGAGSVITTDTTYKAISADCKYDTTVIGTASLDSFTANGIVGIVEMTQSGRDYYGKFKYYTVVDGEIIAGDENGNPQTNTYKRNTTEFIGIIGSNYSGDKVKYYPISPWFGSTNYNVFYNITEKGSLTWTLGGRAITDLNKCTNLGYSQSQQFSIDGETLTLSF